MLLTLQFVSLGQNRSRLNASRVSHRIPSIHNWYALTWRCRGARLIQCNINDQRHTAPFNYTRSPTLYFLHARFSIPCSRRSPDPVPLVPSIRHQFHSRNVHLVRSSCKGDVPWWRPHFAAISTRACDHSHDDPSRFLALTLVDRFRCHATSSRRFVTVERPVSPPGTDSSRGFLSLFRRNTRRSIVLSYVEWNSCEFWYCSF